jgi:hypothetical protein
MALFKKKEQKKQPTMAPVEMVNVVLKEKGLVISQIETMLYGEKYTANDKKECTRNVVILTDRKRRYKLPVNMTDSSANARENYALKGTRLPTIYLLYQRHGLERFRQLSLADMDMDPTKHKPINEDMGKVLAKIYQDNLNAKKKPQSMIAGLTKTLFYAFILSVVVYAVMYGVNIYFTSAALQAFNSAAAAINHYISVHPQQYAVASVNATTTIPANTTTTIP